MSHLVESGITETTVWKEYGFTGKPGDVKRLPPQVAPATCGWTG